MKKLLSLLCVLFLVQTILAQKTKIEYSPLYKSEGIWFYNSYMGSLNNGPVIFRGRFLETYSAELERMSTIELEFKNAKSLNLVKASDRFMLNDKLYFFASGFKQKAKSLYAVSYELESKDQPDLIKIDQSNNEETEWNVFLSDSKKTIYTTAWVQLTKEQKKANKKTREHQLAIKEYDPAFNLLNEHNIELPYAGQEFTVHSTLVRNAQVFILVSVVDNQIKPKKKVSPSGFYLLKYEMQSGKLTEQELTLANASVISGVQLFATDSKVVVAGMCRKEMKGNNSGFVLSVHNMATLNNEMETKTEFDEDVYGSIYPKRKLAKGKDLSLDYMGFKTAHIKANGNIILVGEVNYQVTKQSGSFNTVYYHTDAMIASEISPKGEVIWQRGINKKQENTIKETSQLSCTTFIRDNQFYVLHFDYEMNPEPGLICETFDETGTNKKELLFGFKHAQDLLLGGADVYPESENTLILIIPKIKKFKIVRIHLPSKS